MTTATLEPVTYLCKNPNCPSNRLAEIFPPKFTLMDSTDGEEFSTIKLKCLICKCEWTHRTFEKIRD